MAASQSGKRTVIYRLCRPRRPLPARLPAVDRLRASAYGASAHARGLGLAVVRAVEKVELAAHREPLIGAIRVRVAALVAEPISSRLAGIRRRIRAYRVRVGEPSRCTRRTGPARRGSVAAEICFAAGCSVEVPRHGPALATCGDAVALTCERRHEEQAEERRKSNRVHGRPFTQSRLDDSTDVA